MYLLISVVQLVGLICNRTSPLGDVNTCYWYYKTHLKLCTDPSLHILCPIILFEDKTFLDTKGHLRLHPVLSMEEAVLCFANFPVFMFLFELSCGNCNGYFSVLNLQWFLKTYNNLLIIGSSCLFQHQMQQINSFTSFLVCWLPFRCSSFKLPAILFYSIHHFWSNICSY